MEQEVGVQNLPPPCYVLEQDTLLPEISQFLPNVMLNSAQKRVHNIDRSFFLLF